ncbi:MAG: 4Fe-4S binding protein [Deferribacteraceae bacterium]|jgi:Pyruvate/2-oxoacid:ferredoxin oxidoreductase delta subunit|nr:4Fe-4S binding protein [Deferribacteraceae bacterium]
MTNSSESLISFVDNLAAADIYVEDNFPLSLRGTVNMQTPLAISFLLGSAMVGNKVVGFFHKLPPFVADKPLRAACLFFSSQLPDVVQIPLFFCKTPEQLADILPRAVKASTDSGLPVQVVLSANVLNNYVSKPISYDLQDKVLPHFSADVASWKPAQKNEKLKTTYTYTAQALPPQEAQESISFELVDAWFPEFIMPIRNSAQVDQLKNLTEVKTTERELVFVHNWINGLLGLNITVSVGLEPELALTKSELCPGCPFMAIYACKDIVAYAVFSSVCCAAVRDIYGVTPATYSEFRGIVAKKLNIQPLFVGTASDAPDAEQLANGTVLILQDTAKQLLPPIAAINKLKQIKNSSLPYSCTNIKKTSLPKLNVKKCNCISSTIKPICKDNTHCPALYEGEETIQINKLICSGCRVCASYCPTKALS